MAHTHVRLTRDHPWRWFTRLVVAVIATHGTAAIAVCGEPLWERLPSPTATKVGSLSCASATCHGNADELSPGESIAGHEHTMWVEFDPHAKAATTVQSARYRAVLDTYHRGLPSGMSVAAAADRCAVCHDPQGLATTGSRPQGIGCEDCHGPAEKWLASHYQRTATRDSLRADGFLDMKNLVTRGRVCAGCHVGDAEHQLTHDMYAAGHPALRFELSAYHDLIARKHWPEQERLGLPAFKLRLWAAGQAAVADAILGQLEARAATAATPVLRDARGASVTPREDRRSVQGKAVGNHNLDDASWPEFAEYDCFGCHQRLRSVAASTPPTLGADGQPRTLPGPDSQPSRLQAVAARPGIREQLSRAATDPQSTAAPLRSVGGIPAWQPWNQGLGGVIPDAVFAPARTLMEARFASDPAAVRAAAQAGRRALRDSPTGPLGWTWSDLAVPAVLTTTGQPQPIEDNSRENVERLFVLLESIPATPVDWSDASQRWLALNTLVRTFRDERRRGSLEAHESPSLERLAASLRFGSNDFDWPRYDWTGLPGTPLSGKPSATAVQAGKAGEREIPLAPAAGNAAGNAAVPALAPAAGDGLGNAPPAAAGDVSLDPLLDLTAIGLQFRAIVGQLRAEWPGRPAAAR